MSVVFSLLCLGFFGVLMILLLRRRWRGAARGPWSWRRFRPLSHHQRIHDPKYLNKILKAEGIPPRR